MMKKAGASLSNNNDAASNRCSTTKKLTVIGRSQPKGTRKPPKFIVISYIKKKWELLFKTEKELDKICQTGARGGGKVPNPTFKEVANLIDTSGILKTASDTVFYKKPVGLSIQG